MSGNYCTRTVSGAFGTIKRPSLDKVMNIGYYVPNQEHPVSGRGGVFSSRFNLRDG